MGCLPGTTDVPASYPCSGVWEPVPAAEGPHVAFLALHSEYVRQLAREVYADLGDAGAAAGRVNGGFPRAVTAQPQVDSDIDVLHLQVK